MPLIFDPSLEKLLIAVSMKVERFLTGRNGSLEQTFVSPGESRGLEARTERDEKPQIYAPTILWLSTYGSRSDGTECLYSDHDVPMGVKNLCGLIDDGVCPIHDISK